MVKVALLFLMMTAWLSVSAREAADSVCFRHAEDSLHNLARSIPFPRADDDRMLNHEVFATYFSEVLRREGSFDYPFDSLQTVSLLYAPDRSFRIITWYVPLSGQRFHYAGYLQFPGQDDIPEVVPLTDSSPGIDRKKAEALDPGSWYGAFYYDLIFEPGMDHYILLGWKGYSPQVRKRVIEPLRLKDGKAVFGRQVFGEPWENNWRIVFAYSARTSMSLQYEKDGVRSRQGNYPMIVFDRLEPIHRSLKGHYQFYKPEVNIFDGLFYAGEKWNYAGDVDVRLPERDE